MRRLIAFVLVAVVAGVLYVSNRTPLPESDGVIVRTVGPKAEDPDATPRLDALRSNERVEAGPADEAKANDRSTEAIDAPEAKDDATPSIRVRVIDDEGTPVPGIDIEIAGHIAGAESASQWAFETTRAPDGVARFDLAPLLDRTGRLARMGIETTVVARADIPSARPMTVTFEGGLQDGTTVDLVLESTGSVAVRILDADGEPFLGDASMYYWWAPAEERLRDPDAALRRVKHHHRDAIDGVVQIDGIGLGVVLRFIAQSDGLEASTLNDVPGPIRPGDVHTVDIRLGRPRPAFVFQVLGARGEPVANAKIWAHFIEVPSPDARGLRPVTSRGGMRTTTDAQGRVRLLSQARVWPVDRVLDIEVPGDMDDAHADPGWRVGTLPLPREIKPSATIDLGSVHVVPTPVLAEGVVVDESGAPISQVSLRFVEIYGRDGGRSTNLPDGSVRSDENGRFLVRGVRPPEALGVRLYHLSYASAGTLDLPVGSRNVVLEMKRKVVKEPEPTGQIALELKMAPGTAFMRLGLYWKSPKTGHSTECPPPGVGPFELKNLPPGSYSVWVKSRDGHMKLGMVEDIVVVAGQTTRDPRLLPLDLTNVLRTVELQLVHPSGTPLHKARPTIILDEVGKSFGVRCGKTGQVSFIVPHGVTRIAVSLNGATRIEVPLPAERGTIRVEIP